MRKNPLSNMSAHGGLITSEFLETIRGDKVNNPRVEPQSFKKFNEQNPPEKLQIEDSFKQLLERWDSISNRYQKMSVSEARSKWMLLLLKELGFDPDFRREDIIVGGDDKLRFHLSHRGWSSESAPMIHTVAPSQDLEEASNGTEGEVVRRGRTRSPHDEMQAYLNVTKHCKWGIVTNGIELRLLREYFHTTTKGYVEFDVDLIFRERSFTDFRAMYRMVHASRFLTDKNGVSPLEQFYKESVAAGVKVGEDLRQNVKKAIEALGNGFLKSKPELSQRMIEDEEFCKAYYAEILRVIYRLLFLLFAEQRAMLPTKESLYIEEYSITRLRQMAEERHGKDDHCDLWEGLKVTFQMLKKGCSPLKIFGYNGSLFDNTEIPTLSDLSCKNEYILEAVRNLTLIEQEKILKRINYLDLGVSEIGSIYESLLDYSPKVFATEQEIDGQKILANAFVLDPRGAARKTSGSYYTNPGLIDELILHALKPVLEKRVSETAEKEKALLSIKVCDPACGSGAFLIAANNFLGKELAMIRTGQTEPSDKELKKATRDVLQHCIYGVDLNSMATELAKVSLWINSCVQDMPLNFLNHHIKCGNSLIGATIERLESGIPDDAFIFGEGDNKNFVKKVRNQNTSEKKQTLMLEFNHDAINIKASEFTLIDNSLELSPEDVEDKKKKYASLTTSLSWQLSKALADAWTSAFFWQLNATSYPPTEATLRLIKSKGLDGLNLESSKKVEDLAKSRCFIHWYLEFPDVFSNGGFDVVLGNPPFMGSYKIRGIYGEKFTNFLGIAYAPAKGLVDLCAYFFRLAFSLLKQEGYLGMVATKTIGQGDTRETGIATLIKNQGSVVFAKRFVKWVGTANVEVNLLAIKKGNWNGLRILDNETVNYISSRLDSQPENEIKRLCKNENKAFIGDFVRGSGFLLEDKEASKLIVENPKNSDCILTYLTGEDLNTDPRQKTTRFVICFRDWELQQAMNYPDLLEILRVRVKPGRDSLRDKIERENWWLFARYRGELRRAIAGLNRVIARSVVSELHSLAFIPTNICCSHAMVIFAYDDFYHFAVLQSGVHEVWLRKNASTLRTDIRYKPTTCFETFPFPSNVTADNFKFVENAANEYYSHREAVMISKNIGLTELLNLVNSQESKEQQIETIRQLIVNLDDAVLKCYGWIDLTGSHSFYRNERGKTRFGINIDTQNLILNRLTILNEKQSKESQ